jgi:phosphoribosylanthranilate isomerase
VTRIKVCGITRWEDALLAAELGADALGFVFVSRSPRRADPNVVARIVTKLPPFVTAVGVFQDQALEEVREIVDGCRLDWVQLHGSEDDDYMQRLGSKVLKAVSIARREDLGVLAQHAGRGAFLLDTAVGGAAGGTGKTFDWAWAVEAKTFGRIVLAGGLHGGNVAEAIRRVQPWAVDAASGTEAAPGIKDSEKLRSFIRAARRAD